MLPRSGSQSAGVEGLKARRPGGLRWLILRTRLRVGALAAHARAVLPTELGSPGGDGDKKSGGSGGKPGAGAGNRYAQMDRVLEFLYGREYQGRGVRGDAQTAAPVSATACWRFPSGSRRSASCFRARPSRSSNGMRSIATA